MFPGVFSQDIQPIDKIMPYPPYPTYPSGLSDKDNSIYRYSHKSSDSPNLTIVDPIYDNDGNVILSGYYSLVLSDDRKFLLLLQSEKIIAVLPVFKIEEDKIQFEQLKDKKYQKKLAKKQKAQNKIDAKRAKSGLGPEVKEVYMKATIEYDKIGAYYLVKYERERIRAWGAIKE